MQPLSVLYIIDDIYVRNIRNEEVSAIVNNNMANYKDLLLVVKNKNEDGPGMQQEDFMCQM